MNSSKDTWINVICFSEVRIALLALELFMLFIPGAVVIVTKCGRIVRKVRLLVRFGSTHRTFRTTHFVTMAVVVYSVLTQLSRIFQT